MGYKDTEILDARHRAEAFQQEQTAQETIDQEVAQSIYDPVMFITKLPVEFSDQPILEGAATMRMPIDFEPQSAEVISQSYIGPFKPQYLLMNGYLPFSLVLTTSDGPISNEQIAEIFPLIKDTVTNLGPKTRVFSAITKKVDDVPIKVIRFISHTLTDPLYNELFLCSVQGRLLVGNLACTSNLMKRYKPIMEEMIESLRIVTIQEEGAE